MAEPHTDLSGALQENLLTLAAFSPTALPVIRMGIMADDLDSAAFQTIATRCFAYYEQFGQPVGDHLPDVLEDMLRHEDSKKAALYQDIVAAMMMSKDTINEAYVLGQLTTVVRTQRYKAAVLQSIDLVQGGDLEKVARVWHEVLSLGIEAFQVGTRFDRPEEALRFIGLLEEADVILGIPPLDQLGIGLVRKEMLVLMALAGRGKSWFLIHVGKQALLQRMKVLHVTCEMSEARVAKRYVQSIFSVSNRDADIPICTFTKSDHGQLLTIAQETLVRPTLQDNNITQLLATRIAAMAGKLPMIIKEFPTGQLTMDKLLNYLDGLERLHQFVPDVILLDYPELMELDRRDYRLSINKIYQDLRGKLAVERNVCLATVSQSNRQGERARWLMPDNTGEDYSKFHTADIFLTHNCSDQEDSLGLARLYLAKARNEKRAMRLCLTQAYAIGQYCLDAAVMKSEPYWNVIGESGEEEK